MSKQGFNEVLVADLADGTQLVGSTSEALLVPDFQFQTRDARIYPGATIRYTAFFDVSEATTTGTLTLRLRWGTSLTGTVLAATGAYAFKNATVTNRAGMIQFLTTIRSLGSSGSAFTMGHMMIGSVDDTSATTLKGNVDMFPFPSTPAAVTIDTTSATPNLGFTGQFSTTVATTQITVHQRIIELLN